MKTQKFRITTNAYQNIIKKIGSLEPEKGGILIGRDGVITDFIFDKKAQTTGSTYALDVVYLNPIIKELKAQGKQLMGIIHSHPYGYSKLSDPDKVYFLSQFKNFPNLEWMFTPIVFSAKQDEFEIFPYVFHKNGNIETSELEILPNDYEAYTTKENKSDSDQDSKPNSITNEEKVTKRKQLLVIIRKKVESPTTEKEPIDLSRTAIFGILISSMYFFILGVCAGVFPLATLYIIKNILK